MGDRTGAGLSDRRSECDHLSALKLYDSKGKDAERWKTREGLREKTGCEAVRPAAAVPVG